MTRFFRVDYQGAPRYVVEQDGAARRVPSKIVAIGSRLGRPRASARSRQGDTVTIKVEGVGEFVNTVTRREGPLCPYGSWL